MRRGVAGSAAATFVALVTAVVVLPGPSAGAGTDPEGLLRRAREASTRLMLAGTVEVRWRDGSTVHVEQTGARARGGSYVVGRDDNVALGTGALRWAADDGIATRWSQAGGAEPPAPGAAWRLDLDGSARVAGRPARVVIAHRADGPVRARFYLDLRTGLLLRRDVLARDGDVERSVRFTRLTTGDIRPAVPRVPDRGPKPVSTAEVGGELVAPERLSNGFRLLGRYVHPDGTVQLFYGDGLFSLSVFEQPGGVDWSSLPEGGRQAVIGSDRARWYATDAGNVVVWEREGVVLTGVSDAPADTVRTAVGSVRAPDRGIVHDVVDFVLDPFDWE